MFKRNSKGGKDKSGSKDISASKYKSRHADIKEKKHKFLPAAEQVPA